MTTRSHKHLKAVICADIRGYTAMVQEDEEKALRQVAKFQSLFTDYVGKHQGKIIAFYGDGVTATFVSAIEAVRLAVELQQEFMRLGIPVRFGMHVGEVSENPSGTIHGEGVQIASAIERAGDAGSVVLSESIHAELFNHPEFVVQHLGKLEFTGIDHPMDVYAIANHGLNVPVRKSAIDRYKRLLPRLIIGALLVGLSVYALWDLANRVLSPDTEADIRSKNIAVKFNDFAGLEGRDELAEMTTHWISSRIEDIPGSRVVGHRAAATSEDMLLATASATERTQFTRLTGASNVLEGQIFPRASGDSLIFEAKLIRLDKGTVEASFGPVSCSDSDPMACVNILSNEILGWWATMDAKVMHPPNYDAYKAYLAAKRVWLENDSLAFAYLDEAIRLDASFPDPYFILASYYFNQGDYASRDSLLDVIDNRFSDLNPRLVSVQEYLEARARGDLLTAHKAFLKEVKYDSTDLFVNTEALINALEMVNSPREAIRLFNMIPIDSLDVNNCEYCLVRLSNAAEAYTAVGEHDSAIALLKMIPSKDYYDYRITVRALVAKDDTVGIAQAVRTAFARKVAFPARLWSDAAWYFKLRGNEQMTRKYARRAVQEHFPSLTHPSSIEGLYLLGDYGPLDSLHLQRIERYGGHRYVMSYAGRIFARTGNESGLARLEEIMKEAEDNDVYHHGNYVYIRGVIASIQGDYNKALDLLESAREQGLSFHGHLYFLDVDLMPLFDHPRFKALINPLNGVQ